MYKKRLFFCYRLLFQELALTNFVPQVSFHIPSKHQKTRSFLLLSERPVAWNWLILFCMFHCSNNILVFFILASSLWTTKKLINLIVWCSPVFRDVCNRILKGIAINRNIDTKWVKPHYSEKGLFFYLGFVSRKFTNHRIAGKGGGHFFNSSLPLSPASQTLRH